MSVRSRLRHDRLLRITFWSIVLVCLVLAWFCFHPIVWQTEDKLMAGTTITLNAVSDFLIVVDYESFEDSPATFDKMNFSLAWLNTLQQEIGPVSLVDADGFTDVDLNQYRCIILTQSASSHDVWAPKLRSYLERGGVVILEMPEGALRTIASADGKGGMRAAQNVTYTYGLAPEIHAALATIDLSNRTEVVGSAGPLEDSTTYMTIDGVPVMYEKKYATGHVITIDFNYGMLLTSLQQGRPLDNFGIRNLTETPKIETADLAMPDTVSLEIPLADALERFLLYEVVNSVMPVVGFWPYFDGMMGAMIVAHHERAIGDLATWMPEYEASFKATSTMFVTSPSQFSDSGLDALHQYRTEIGLAFDLSERSRARVPVGPLSFSPIWRRLNLFEQTESLRETLGESTTLLSSQSVDGLWDPNYTRPFRMLAAADFRTDASYRAPLDRSGYAFMTGLPFMPLDINGKIFNILEFPVTHPVIQSDEDVEALQKMLVQSEESYHECLSVTFEPNFFIENPNLDTFRAWKQLYHIATEQNHWVTGIQPFVRFARARSNAEFKAREGSIMIGNKRTQVLRLETLAPEAGMMVSVPAKNGQKAFVEARRGVHRVREDALLSDVLTTKPVQVFGTERVLVPLAKGFNAIDIIYEAQP